MSKSLLSIVIIHWNTPELLEQRLRELSLYSELEIVVVDNHSQTDLQLLKEKFSQSVWILNSHDLGFARAANQGLLVTTADWVLFLNPDVGLKMEAIHQLLEFAQNHNLDALSPHSESPNYRKPVPSAWSLTVEFSPLKKIIPLFFFQPTTLVGGCLLIKRNVLEKLQGWDERFWLWFEDSDLTRRLVDKGFAIGIAPFSVEHLGGASIVSLSELTRKQLFFHALRVYAIKHFSRLTQDWIRLLTKKYTSNEILPVIKTGITLVIPNLKLSLLESFLTANSHRFGDYTEVIVVTSALKSPELWEKRKKYPTVRFIPLDYNQGFAATVNVGFRTATTSWLATCNDDVVLPVIYWDNVLASVPPRTGSLNPILVNQTVIESAGITIQKQGRALPIGEMPAKTVTKVDATNGAFVVYSAAALQKVGIFDEAFGSYLEDIDLSLRLKRAGFHNIVISDIQVEHARHQTSLDMGRSKKWLDIKNWWLVVLKNWSARDLVLQTPQILLERLKNIWGFIKATQ